MAPFIGRIQLGAPVCHAIEARTGTVRASSKAGWALNSKLAGVLDIDAGTVFVKGLPVDDLAGTRGDDQPVTDVRLPPTARA